MMDNVKIDRINTLAHKAKSVGLTEEEKKRYKAIKIDHIVFARKEEKGLHYNLSV